MYVKISFFCREESWAILGVGVDKLVDLGKLEGLKNGPIFWVDSADGNPRIGNKFQCLGSLFAMSFRDSEYPL